MPRRAALAILVGVAGAATPAAADRVVDIRVDGNTKTTDRTVELIARIGVGDDLTPDVADRVRRDLVSSDLFSDVQVYWEPVAGKDGVRLVIIARDKHSWIVAPAFYNQPTNKGGGVGFGENNLFGENKKLLLYGQVATGDSFFLAAYIDPSIRGSRYHWQGLVYVRSGKITEYAPPRAWRDDPRAVRVSRLRYSNVGVRGGVALSKAISLDLRVRGAKVGYASVKLADGATIEQVTGDPASTMVPPPGGSGWDVSSEAILDIDTRANWYGISSGSHVVVSYEHTLPELSDFTYWYTGVKADHAFRIGRRQNLALKGAFGFGDEIAFQQEYSAGGNTQRGWKNDQFRGDIRAAGSVEYSVPMFTVHGLAVRALGFWDSSYVTFREPRAPSPMRSYLPGSDARGLAPLKDSVGVGTRLYLRQIVLPLLGLDFGYGLERGDYEIYLAIGLTE